MRRMSSRVPALLLALAAVSIPAPPPTAHAAALLPQSRCAGASFGFPIADYGQNQSRIGWLWHADTPLIRRIDGHIHSGVDFWAPVGAPIYVPRGGSVVGYSETSVPGAYRIDIRVAGVGEYYMTHIGQPDLNAMASGSLSDGQPLGQIEGTDGHVHLSIGNQDPFNDNDPSQTQDPSPFFKGAFNADGRGADAEHWDWPLSQWCLAAQPPPATGWATRAPMPTARNGLGFVRAPSGKFYAIGGSPAGTFTSVTNVVEQYDPIANAWLVRTPMPTLRHWAGVAAATNGKIYVVGGYSGAGAVATVEEYDPATDSWTRRHDMPIPRWNLALAAGVNGKLYAIGGQTDGSGGWAYYARVDEYDPVTDSWVSKASMPTARGFFGVATAATGKIYAIGGWRNALVGAVAEYDPSIDTWTTKSSMATPRAALAVAESGGRINAIGGEIPGQNPPYLAVVEAYDPATDRWSPQTRLPTARAGLAAATDTNGTIFAVGGVDNTHTTLGILQAGL